MNLLKSIKQLVFFVFLSTLITSCGGYDGEYEYSSYVPMFGKTGSYKLIIEKDGTYKTRKETKSGDYLGMSIGTWELKEYDSKEVIDFTTDSGDPSFTKGYFILEKGFFGNKLINTKTKLTWD